MRSGGATKGKGGRARFWTAVVLAVSAFATPAIAGADDERESRPGISVRVDSVPLEMRAEIERSDDGEVVLRCLDACVTVLDPGRYRLRLRTSDGETTGTQIANITHPVVFHAVGVDSSAATTGLVLGITGAAIAVSGVIIFGLVALASMCEGDCGPPRGVAIYGLVALSVGAIMTPVGWTMFAHNRRVFRREDVKEHLAASAPTLRFGLVPGARGASGVLTLAF